MLNKRDNEPDPVISAPAIDFDVESADVSINYKSDEGFKSTVCIQFDPIFHKFVVMGIYVSIFGVIIDYTFATNVDETKFKIPDMLFCRLTKVLYTIDVFFLLDVILMILYRRSENMDILENLYRSRHPLILLVEIISIFPLEFVYYHMSEKEMTMFATLRLRYVLRIVRFISIFNNKCIAISSITGQLLVNILIILGISTIISAYYYKELCKIESCDYADWSKFYMILVQLLNATMSVTVSVNSRIYKIYGEEYICLIWIGYFYIIFLRCYFTCVCVEKISGQCDYIIRMERDLALIQIDSMHDKLGKRVVTKFYNIQWKKGMNTDISRIKSYLPDMVIREIKLDSRWNGLKHTHLFRKQSVHFLRHLSAHIKVRYLHGGEVIYRRGHKKLFMMYLTVGNINVICDNGETPMISFGSGTVFGETSLYVPTTTSNTIVCQGFCQVWFLYRADYINIRFKYPEVYKSLQKNISKFVYNSSDLFSPQYAKLLLKVISITTYLTYVTSKRFAKARLYNDIIGQHNEKIGISDHKASLSIKYLKNTLSTLLGNVDMKTQLNQTWSLSHKRFDELRQRTAFCAQYLDLYVLTADIEIPTELNLDIKLTSTMHPDSMLIMLEEKLIVVFCIIYYVIIMTYVCFPLYQYATFFYVLLYFLTIIWIFDLFVQCSVHIITLDAIYTQRLDIFFECLNKSTFYIDIIAAVPLELIFLLLDGDLQPQVRKLFYLNRLLKLYRVFKYFHHLNNDTILLLNLKITLKIFGYLLLLMYGLICVNVYFQEQLVIDLHHTNFVLKISTTLSFITGVTNNRHKLSNKISWLGIIFQIIIFVFFNYGFAMIAAGTSMYIKSYRQFHEIMFHSAWSTQILDRDIEVRLGKHFQLHAVYKQGLNLLDEALFFSAMTDEMKAFSKQIIYSSSLKEAAFLKHLPSSLYADLFSTCSLAVMPAGEIIYYANETATEIYIIKAGTCKSTSASGVQYYKSGDSLNVVPCFMETTSVNTVETITACTCVVLLYDKLKNVMNRFDPTLIKHIKECMEKGPSLDSVRTEAVSIPQQTATKVLSIMVNKQNKHYYKGFPSNVRFLKSLLLHVTFPPDGSFAFYWEVARSVVVLINILVTTVPTAFSFFLSVEVLILLLCDSFSIIDLYIQHHICYFNQLAILVYHPYATAKHYWQHSLCLDLLSTLPFDWIYILTIKRDANLLKASVLRINRYLQLIRVCKFTNYITFKYAYYVKCILIIRWIVLAIYMVQICAYFIITGMCSFHWRSTGYNITCPNILLLQKAFDSKPENLSPHLVSLVGFHIVLAYFSNRNFRKENPIAAPRILFMECVAFIGIVVYISILVSIIAHGLFAHSGLVMYQNRMKNLVHFMSGRVGKVVQKEIIDYYEYIWKKTGGNNLKQIMQIFNTSLRMDSLYSVYGKALKDSGIFPQASKPFIKSFMMHISHEYYRNRGIICMVNNIHGMIYIVFKGSVDVLGPDFNRLLTLGPGSIFGNLDNVPLVRQTLTMIANGHVEVLSIASETFYNVLSKYPSYLKQFKLLTMVHVDYIEAMEVDESQLAESVSTLSKSSNKEHMRNYFTRVRRRSSFVKIWDALIINIAYFLSIEMESFCIIATTHNIFVILFMYIFDLIAAFNMYLKFHTVLRDEFGFTILDKTKISKTYRKAFFGFYFELMATVPLELITLFFINDKHFYLMYHLTRCNRFLRFAMVFKATLQAKQKLNVNVYAIRILSSLLWLSALFCISSILMALVITPAHGTHLDMNSHYSFKTEWEYFITSILNVVKINNGVQLNFDFLYDIKWFTLCTIVILVLLQRFVIDVIFLSQMCATMQILRNNRTKYKNYVTWIKKFMRIEYVSLPLYQRILEYTKLLWLYQNGIHFPSLLNEAPYYIKEAVLNSVFGFHLREHRVFKDCHVDFLRQVVASVKCTYHFNGDVICFIGDIDECMYIIHQGRVAALDKDSLHGENVHTILFSGEIFGIKQALLTRTGHDFTYKALEYTVILTLQRSQFVHLIKFFPASRYVIYKALEELGR